MELEIRNTELTPDDVPTSPDDLDVLETFALSFDGYAHWGPRCGAIAGKAAEAFHEDGTLPTALSDLRACLFYEQQRWRWQDEEPDDASAEYLQALLDAIRDAVAERA